MIKDHNNLWHWVTGILALILGVASLGYDWYPQFPSMCIILGIILFMIIDTIGEIPASLSYNWEKLMQDLRNKKQHLGKSLLFIHAKIIFPTLFTIYLILLICQKLSIVPSLWQSYAGATIDTLKLLWVVLISAILANFSGLPEKSYEIKRTSALANSGTLLLICLLSYLGMWAIFHEIANIGRIAYFVSLGVGILIGMVSVMILVEEDEDQIKEKK